MSLRDIGSKLNRYVLEEIAAAGRWRRASE